MPCGSSSGLTGSQDVRVRCAAASSAAASRTSALPRSASKLDADIAQLRVELQSVHAALAADARLLGAAEGGAQVAQEPAVDPGDADLDRRRDAMRAREVLRPDRGRQAVGASVGARDRVFLAVERREVAARPEDL